MTCPPQTADQPYLDAFNQELEALKERVRGCARARMESAMREQEEEDRQERLGPGGLDPVEIYQSLPEVRSGSQRHLVADGKPKSFGALRKVCV